MLTIFTKLIDWLFLQNWSGGIAVPLFLNYWSHSVLIVGNPSKIDHGIRTETQRNNAIKKAANKRITPVYRGHCWHVLDCNLSMTNGRNLSYRKIHQPLQTIRQIYHWNAVIYHLSPWIFIFEPAIHYIYITFPLFLNHRTHFLTGYYSAGNSHIFCTTFKGTFLYHS